MNGSKNEIDKETNKIIHQFRQTGLVNENKSISPQMDKIFKRLEFFKQHQLLENIDKDISEFKQKVQQKIDFCRNEIKVDLLG